MLDHARLVSRAEIEARCELSERVAVLEEKARHLPTKAWVWQTVVSIAGLFLAIATFARLPGCAS